ncbi:Crg1p [Nannizzia gypsea CBS 118893]|uniref:Crg1p n=1 Tax=Arthroderma gypseum (strain ATCC MYA-4604 / CBS 118893) TaxID=535722 RepID=E4V3G5_ARTGP|nr:Crg1p [Nannizzia gypsea CBS 118893]EFR04539.1 Crg1p [Nannizzia gypsea CBS 118893]
MATFASNNFSYTAYASFRPEYPQKLYDMIFSYHQGEYNTCVDLGCGHGLVSRALAPKFKKVHGIDPSAGMIEQAKNLTQEQNVEFVQAAAESLPFIEDNSVDMVVAGVAAHWFSYQPLFAELQRVMKPGGTLAFWGYSDHFLVDYPKGNAVMENYCYGSDKDSLASYWIQPGSSIMREKLRAIQPPTHEWADVQRIEYQPGLNGPDSGEGTKFMEAEMTLRQATEYTRTWSAYQRWKDDHPNQVRRSEGGTGDIADQMLESIIKAEDSLRDTPSPEDTVVKIEWLSALILGRKL